MEQSVEEPLKDSRTPGLVPAIQHSHVYVTVALPSLSRSWEVGANSVKIKLHTHESNSIPDLLCNLKDLTWPL